MFTLSHVFSSGALFQASATLTVRGFASPASALTAKIAGKDGEFCTVGCTTAADGAFAVTLNTPAASFDPWKITLCCDGDSHVMEDVLFGELWLASGQSNMEMPNATHPPFRALFDAMQGKVIRVFSVAYPPSGSGGAFPWDPDPMVEAVWCAPDDYNRLAEVSAMAYRFAGVLYDFLNEHADVPVGFLNCTWGGTPIHAWFPREAIEADEYIAGLMKDAGLYPTPENWNTRGELNFQQACCQYNVKVAPVEGVKVRGAIWYQGENEAGGQFDNRRYAPFLRFWHRVYAQRFAADPEHFPMLSCLIYAFPYGDDGECNVGYLNDAFIETAVEEPDKFAFVPTLDLPPVWAYHQSNHPIHPMHKYWLGERLAHLALTRVYGATGQTSPATLAVWEADGNVIRLHFRDVGKGLFVKGEGHRPALHGAYVAGENGEYLPADYRITAPDTLELYTEGVDAPKHAAYGMQSLEPCVNLFAGEYPVASFHTDRDTRINIQQKPWYDTGRVACWLSAMHDEVPDLFYRPVWTAEAGTAVCPDTAFKLATEASLRVEAEESDCGCYVKAWPYAALPLSKYAALRVSLFNLREGEAFVTVDGLTFPLMKIADEVGGWARYEASLEGVPEERASRLGFRFRLAKNTDYRFVNLERIRMIPR